MTITEEKVLEFHRGGKVALKMPRPVRTVEDLCLAYTPGVGKAVLHLDKNPEAAFEYTARGRPSPSFPTAPRSSASATAARPPRFR